ncbi:MAG TPA: hypothetical protein VFF65_02495 [Phycisphaerales bacterium]|nr:hypothetical protein [Phycisphaerales bacterium]
MSTTTAHTPEEHETPDQWHTHTVEEHPQEAHGEQLDGIKVFIIGLAGYLLTVATIAVVTVYFVSYKTNDQIQFEEYPERSIGDSAALQKPALDKRAAELGNVSGATPVWTDPEAGKVTIPMNQAMDKVIDKYGKRQAAR